MLGLVRYDAACAALAEAVQADGVMAVQLEARAIQAVARVAKNFDLEIDAVKLRTRAEVRLGEMLEQGEHEGIIARRGRPKKDADAETLPPATLPEIGIDPKLSSRSRKLSGIGQQAVDNVLRRFEEESRRRGRLATDVLLSATAKRNADTRRNLARELSDTSALMPIGRKFPVVYADPAWQRKAGIGDRAYENHFPTMTWDEICALPVADMMLPDAWLFLWIPRAHLLAPTKMAHDLGLATCVEIEVPLAWRVARERGFRGYSTCFVWTKTDEDVPDDHGTGLITWDQDELLLLFKRGNGLPKPDTDCKFGSNHRERPRGHSRKPDYYRHMIRAMAGDGVPVLELFARFDPDNPWPADWHTWGNQDQPVDDQGCAIDHDAVTGECAA